MTLVRLLGALGYGARREVEALLRAGRVQDAQGRPCGPGDRDPGGELRIDGVPLDPRPPLVVLLHKPLGRVCTRADGEGPTVYVDLPGRWARRRPPLSPVGRLDKETSGLLLLTDDGALLHRLTSPRHAVPKAYRAHLARDLRGDEGAALAAGTLALRGEARPLLPATLEVLGPREVRLTVTEGRYHLVRRAFAALGNHVEALHRESLGPLGLGALPPGAWRVLDAAEQALLRS